MTMMAPYMVSLGGGKGLMYICVCQCTVLSVEIHFGLSDLYMDV